MSLLLSLLQGREADSEAVLGGVATRRPGGGRGGRSRGAGTAARFVLVLGVLVIVGIVRRAAFADAALGFLAVYTVYMLIRLFANPTRTAK